MELREEKFGRIAFEDSESLERLNGLLLDISEKYRMSNDNILELIKGRQKYAAIPASILNSELSPLETVTIYLNQKLGFNQSEIARMLSRDHTTIWTTIKNAHGKKSRFVEKDDFFIPVSILKDRKFSILENASVYLKSNYGLSNHEIAVLTGKDDRTIWTVLNRAANKLKKRLKSKTRFS